MTPPSRHWRRSAPNASARQADAPVKIAELSKTSSWDRGNVIERSGFALMPGEKTADSDVARACAESLSSRDHAQDLSGLEFQS